jgi:DNA-binding response OmpR family regulator
LDVLLPGMDGMAVCRELRRQGVTTPVLMLTARDAIGDRVRGLDAGADDYLVKPFALAELLARIRALGRRGDGRLGGEVLTVGDLRLDLEQRQATRGDRSIELTAKEFQLLEYLMRHAGRLLTKDQILHHVWGYDAEVSSNVTEIYVHYLRDKIDRGFADPLIRTVRGAGYMLKE